MDALPPYLESLREYPRWFVIACMTVVAAVGLWFTAKMLKWTLYLLLTVVLLAGGAAVIWLLLR